MKPPKPYQPIRQVSIKGSGPTVWIVALALARFVMPEPNQVTVEYRAPQDGNLIVRPEFQRLAKAIGIDMTQVPAALPLSFWDRDIPFQPYGRPLGIVPMETLLVKARVSDWRDYNPAFGPHPPQGQAYQVDAQALEQTCRAIAQQVGITVGGKTQSDLVIETEEFGPIWDGVSLRLGTAVSGDLERAYFSLLTCQITVMELVRFWPDRTLNPIELDSYARRIALMLAPIKEMQALISADGADTRRKRLWRKAAKLSTIDFDPFQPYEWIGALLRRDGLPNGYSVMADIIDETAIWDHLKSCQNKVSLHV